MTEVSWLRSVDPADMLFYLDRRSLASARKLLLFGVGCCRLEWYRFSNRQRRVVEQVEAFADGGIDRAALEELTVSWPNPFMRGRDSTARVTQDLLNAALRQNGIWNDEPLWERIRRATAEITFAASMSNTEPLPYDEDFDGPRGQYDLLDEFIGESDLSHCARVTVGHQQAELVRDVFVNPFRPVRLDPLWLTSSVVGLAGGAYQERAFDRLPILADALEEAGCVDETILAHCRGYGPHTRGCWVLDRLLGRQ